MSKRLLNKSLLLVSIMVFTVMTNALPAGKQEDKTSAELIPVKLAFGWTIEWSYAGYLVADHLGYYAEEGLEVEFLPGGPGIQQIPLVGAGQVEFVTLGPDDVWKARLQKIPVVNVLTVFQRGAYVYMVLADSGIEEPLDFVGKTVQVFEGEFRTNYEALAAAVGLDRSTVNEVPGTFEITPLLNGDVDVQPVYITDQPNIARQRGFEVNVIAGADYGVPSIGNGLATSEMLIDENPEVVQAFVNASMRGWLWAMENLEESAEIVRSYNDMLDPDHVVYQAESGVLLITDNGAVEGGQIGVPIRDRWDALLNMELELDVLETPVPFDEANDTSFIENFYVE